MKKPSTSTVKIFPPPTRPVSVGKNGQTGIWNTTTVIIKAERLAVPEPIKKKPKPAAKGRKPTKGKKKS